MALFERDDPGDDSDDTLPGLRPMSPERAAERDATLQGMLAGEDEDPDSHPKRADKASKKGKARSPSSGDEGGRAARVAQKKAAKAKARRIAADPDDPANDDLDESDLEDLEEGLLDPDPPKARPKFRPPPKKRALTDHDDDDDEDTEPDDDDDEEEDELDDATPDDDDDEDQDQDQDDDEDDDQGEDDEEAGKASARIRAMERKSLARIAARDRRSKEQDRERRLEQDRREQAFLRDFEPREAKVKAIEAIVAAAKSNPIGAALQFAEEVAGLQGDDWEVAGKQYFTRSPRFQADPKNREIGLRTQREIEARNELEQVKQANKALQDRIDAREQAEENERQVAAYMKRVTESITSETRLVRRMMRKNPERAQRELHELAVEYIRQNGASPSPAKLVRLKEKRERGRLLELGIDPASLFSKKSRSQDTENASDKKQAKKGKANPAPSGKNGKQLKGRDLLADVERGLGQILKQ